jgi:hypothetical protein
LYQLLETPTRKWKRREVPLYGNSFAERLGHAFFRISEDSKLTQSLQEFVSMMSLILYPNSFGTTDSKARIHRGKNRSK